MFRVTVLLLLALSANAAPGSFYASAPIIDVRLVCLLCDCALSGLDVECTVLS